MGYVVNKSTCYLHIPKTGGNWIKNLLINSGTKEIRTNKISKHATYDLLVGASSNRIFSRLSLNKINFFCVVRHPLLWYQSWFNYQHQEAWKDWGQSGTLHYRKWHCLSPLNMPKQDDFNEFIKIINQTSPGFLTYLYHSFTLPSGARVLKNESLRDDLLNLNKEWNLGIKENLIISSDRINVSKKSDISWTAKNVVETLQNESAIFEKYDYKKDPESIIKISG